MLHIAFCDNDIHRRLNLRTLLEPALASFNEKARIDEFAYPVELLEAIEQEHGLVDLAFLSCTQREEATVFADRLREMDRGLQIVFCIVAAGAAGTDCIRFPLSAPEVARVLRSALDAMHAARSLYLHFPYGRDTCKVPFPDILYLCGDHRRIALKTAYREYVFGGALDKLAHHLPSDQFIKIHPRYYIGRRYLGGVAKNTVLINGETLPMTTSFRRTVLLTYARAVLKKPCMEQEANPS